MNLQSVLVVLLLIAGFAGAIWFIAKNGGWKSEGGKRFFYRVECGFKRSDCNIYPENRCKSFTDCIHSGNIRNHSYNRTDNGRRCKNRYACRCKRSCLE